jgi:hypothetical protein
MASVKSRLEQLELASAQLSTVHVVRFYDDDSQLIALRRLSDSFTLHRAPGETEGALQFRAAQAFGGNQWQMFARDFPECVL